MALLFNEIEPIRIPGSGSVFFRVQVEDNLNLSFRVACEKGAEEEIIACVCLELFRMRLLSMGERCRAFARSRGEGIKITDALVIERGSEKRIEYTALLQWVAELPDRG